jgi:hypothetical protein
MEPYGHEEGTESRGLANLFVVVEFCNSQPVRPIVLQEIGENPEILLDILVDHDAFSLSIGLWMVCCRGVRLYQLWLKKEIIVQPL